MRTSKYTKEFKESTVQLALNSDEAVTKIADDLGIHVKTLYNWISTYKKEHNIPTRGATQSSSAETVDEEIKRLRKENKLLKQERDILKKATGVLRQRSSVKYAWIYEHKEEFSITLMCKVFKVDRSSYYHWIDAGCVVKKEDTQLNELIEAVFVEGKQLYGTRRIQSKLKELYGLLLSRKRIAGIMKDLNLKVKMKRRHKNTTDSNHNLPIAPNLLNRDFYASAPDMKYVGDITYIFTGEGWLYLATVIDLYSRKVVGWSMDDTMKVSLVNDALNMALSRRNPPKGLIWHTDRGSQYASYSHRDLLQKHGIVQSMSRKGNCWDNAVAESFFKTLKSDLVYQTYFYTKAEAKRAIFEYIEFYYNRVRSHSYLGNLSPCKFEKINSVLQNEIAA
ncbi:MAG: IS3 family transposase [Campylobacteraceae bacterium]|nr:IS3 family transposase [Campylobacteraceae bacterium]